MLKSEFLLAVSRKVIFIFVRNTRTFLIRIFKILKSEILNISASQIEILTITENSRYSKSEIWKRNRINVLRINF